MEKAYKLRGKEYKLEELDGIKAIKPAINSRVSFLEMEKEIDPQARKTFKNLKKSFSDASNDLKAFSDAGWFFTKPNDKALKAISSRENNFLETYGRVYKNKSGNLLIGTNLLTMKFLPSLKEEDIAEIMDRFKLRVVRKLGFSPNLFEVEITPSRDTIDVANELSIDDSIIYIEPQMISHMSQRFRPSDPQYHRQWQCSNKGQNGGTAGADINAENAWDITKGRGVKLAIVDNGFDVNHPDFKSSIYTSAGYFSYRGYFLNTLNGYPDNNHGTFCAGMAVARANNVGVVGSANQADFIPVACLGDQVGTQSTLARAIAYAADPSLEVSGLTQEKGADVIACSLGPNGANWDMESVLEDAIDFCVTHGRNGLGAPIFWAVSNGNYTIDGKDGTDEVSAFPNTIAVGRSDKNDMENGSAYGNELDFLAPGAAVFSCNSGGGYGSSTGTSFAAPLAAGVGALLISKNPNLKWTEVRQALRDSCDKIGGVNYDASGHHSRYGYGRINAFQALKKV